MVCFKINYMKFKIFLATLIFICILVFLVYQLSSKLVFTIDGNENSKMVHIFDNFFYDDDSSIWYYEKKITAYKCLTTFKVDSLSKDENYIFGFGNEKYFKINIISLEFINCSSRKGFPILSILSNPHP